MKLWAKISAVFAALLMVFTIAACSPTPKTEGTGGYFDDSVITTKVKTALLGEKNLNSTQISVETFKGKVQLSGFVSSEADANRAIDTTRNVKGVKGVINSMSIR
nr:BON domain-containing protein [Proteus myxofaciens]